MAVRVGLAEGGVVRAHAVDVRRLLSVGHRGDADVRRAVGQLGEHVDAAVGPGVQVDPVDGHGGRGGRGDLEEMRVEGVQQGGPVTDPREMGPEHLAVLPQEVRRLVVRANLGRDVLGPDDGQFARVGIDVARDGDARDWIDAHAVPLPEVVGEAPDARDDLRLPEEGHLGVREAKAFAATGVQPEVAGVVQIVDHAVIQETGDARGPDGEDLLRGGLVVQRVHEGGRPDDVRRVVALLDVRARVQHQFDRRGAADVFPEQQKGLDGHVQELSVRIAVGVHHEEVCRGQVQAAAGLGSGHGVECGRVHAVREGGQLLARDAHAREVADPVV